MQESRENGFARASLILGILSIFLWEFSIFPLLAIILGVVGFAKSGLRRSVGLAGIVLGIVFLIVRLNQL